ncbi:hypothetical protein [Mesorhizobium sp. CAU 1741]|uniref:hypothetical protein n=1 Tax=Mesorhizobium sp. CAU 1741 TaxID=3140366 RepID=UPI00325A676B
MYLTVPMVSRRGGFHSLGDLQFHRKVLKKSQPRLAGRFALKPDVDLDDYTCRAVIDWIEIRFFLGRSTQFQWLRREIEEAIEANAYAVALEEKAGGVTDVFDVRLQEPSILQLRELERHFERKYGLHMIPLVRSMEISVDFYPREQGEEARARLHTALTRHFWTSQTFFQAPGSRPRFVPGLIKKVSHVVRYKSTASMQTNDHFAISTEEDQPPSVDTTYYIGPKEGPVSWRIMDKVVDNQNRATGTRRELAEAEKRTRIEVTLGQTPLSSVGVEHLYDLEKLNFARLQGEFFKFMLPTFVDERQLKPGRRVAMMAWTERRRAEKFRNAGVIGLQVMDDALKRKEKPVRKDLLAHLARKGLKARPSPRHGKGPVGNLVAYEEINERVGIALRNLGKRVAGDFSAVLHSS